MSRVRGLSVLDDPHADAEAVAMALEAEYERTRARMHPPPGNNHHPHQPHHQLSEAHPPLHGDQAHDDKDQGHGHGHGHAAAGEGEDGWREKRFWTTVATCASQIHSGAVTLGFSPVLLKVLEAFTKGNLSDYGITSFYGVWIQSCAFFLSYGLFLPILPSFLSSRRHNVIVAIAGSWLISLSVALLALSVQLDWVWLAFVGFGPTFGLGSACVNISAKISFIAWWRLDDRVHVGASLTGGTYGVAALLVTLGSGFLLSHLSTPTAIYIEAAVLGVISIVPTFLYLTQRAEAIPPVSRHAPKQAPRPSTASNASTGSTARRRATRDRNVMFALQFVFTAAMSTTGFGQKQLLSILFDQIYDESFTNSYLLSALSLVVFGVARFAFPYFTAKVDIFWMYIVVYVISIVVYALDPTLISLGNVWLFVGAKSVTGGCFAIKLTLQNLLALAAFGNYEDFKALYPFICIALAFGAVVGPSTAWGLRCWEMSRGVKQADAFNLFFYVAAGVESVALVCLVVTRQRVRRREAQKRAALLGSG